MIKILFMIPNLGHGGAEKVLVNLVNHMDKSKFDITVMTLYDEGVNRQFLNSEINYKSCMKKSFPGVAHLLKLFSPQKLYKHFVKEQFDIVVSYLEGQTARIVSGCLDKATPKVCWIHRTMRTPEDVARLFRDESEARECYSSFDKIVYVSKDVQKAFMQIFPFDEKGIVLYNTNESDEIKKKATETAENIEFSSSEFKICAMGTLVPVKGFERLIRIHKQLNEKYSVHTYILGEGPDKEKLLELTRELKVEESVTFLGYQKNPYKYMAQCDLFVCSSFSEGFSTAVTEALILGVPVITTRVSGMEELLGNDNQYGVVVENDEEALYKGLNNLFDNKKLLKYYQKQAEVRGKSFNIKDTVKAVEDMLISLV